MIGSQSHCQRDCRKFNAAPGDVEQTGIGLRQVNLPCIVRSEVLFADDSSSDVYEQLRMIIS